MPEKVETDERKCDLTSERVCLDSCTSRNKCDEKIGTKGSKAKRGKSEKEGRCKRECRKECCMWSRERRMPTTENPTSRPTWVPSRLPNQGPTTAAPVIDPVAEPSSMQTSSSPMEKSLKAISTLPSLPTSTSTDPPVTTIKKRLSYGTSLRNMPSSAQSIASSPSVSIAPTESMMPSLSPSISSLPSVESSEIPSMMPSLSYGTSLSNMPSSAPSITSSPSVSIAPTESMMKDLTPGPSSLPTMTLTVDPIPIPTNPPIGTPPDPSTGDFSHTPLIDSTAIPSQELTVTSSQEPSQEPMVIYSKEPTAIPSKELTAISSEKPSLNPSQKPTMISSEEPSLIPSLEPTVISSEEPTAISLQEQTAIPSEELSLIPSQEMQEPSLIPSLKTTAIFSEEPASIPSQEPTAIPSEEPSFMPSLEPTAISSKEPTMTSSQELTEISRQAPTATSSQRPSQESTAISSKEPTVISSQEPTVESSQEPAAKSLQVFTTIPMQEPTVIPSQELIEGCRTKLDGTFGVTSSARALFLNYNYEVELSVDMDPEEVQNLVIPSVENAINDGLLPLIFPSCGDGERRRQLVHEGRERLRGLRRLEEVLGVSTRPMDLIQVDEKCQSEIGVGSTCMAIRGGLTLFAKGDVSELWDPVIDTIQANMQEGTFKAAHSFIVSLHYIEGVKEIPINTPGNRAYFPETGITSSQGIRWVVVAGVMTLGMFGAILGWKKYRSRVAERDERSGIEINDIGSFTEGDFDVDIAISVSYSSVEFGNSTDHGSVTSGEMEKPYACNRYGISMDHISLASTEKEKDTSGNHSNSLDFKTIIFHEVENSHLGKADCSVERKWITIQSSELDQPPFEFSTSSPPSKLISSSKRFYKHHCIHIDNSSLMREGEEKSQRRLKNTVNSGYFDGVNSPIGTQVDSLAIMEASSDISLLPPTKALSKPEVLVVENEEEEWSSTKGDVMAETDNVPFPDFSLKSDVMDSSDIGVPLCKDQIVSDFFSDISENGTDDWNMDANSEADEKSNYNASLYLIN